MKRRPLDEGKTPDVFYIPYQDAPKDTTLSHID
jgi:hypothetical protein